MVLGKSINIMFIILQDKKNGHYFSDIAFFAKFGSIWYDFNNLGPLHHYNIVMVTTSKYTKNIIINIDAKLNIQKYILILLYYNLVGEGTWKNA